MLHRTAYCPATDRDVPVVFRPGALDRDPAHLHAPGAFVCLDFGVRCTGAMCPLRAVPRNSADLHLHREGLLRLHRSEAATP